MIGTKIFKIGGQIIWKNEPEDGNPPLKIGYNSLHESLSILEKGLPSSSSFFWVIIQSILKGFVPVMKHLSILNIPKHPNFPFLIDFILW